jgi:prepilin signal peptidase PulO-like enzyme (type II secretory pathway)
MGYGDSFLALLIGLALGSLASFLAILLAFCIGAICSIFIILLGKAGLKSQVPFGPFLIFAFFVVFFINMFSPILVESFI